MLANLSLPRYTMIHVKCWQDIFYGFEVLIKKITANTTHNSCQGICVFDEPSQSCRRVAVWWVKLHLHILPVGNGADWRASHSEAERDFL